MAVGENATDLGRDVFQFAKLNKHKKHQAPVSTGSLGHKCSEMSVDNGVLFLKLDDPREDF